jgi:leader peptidase (prepilin peptidase)/N-methyltransferase
VYHRISRVMGAGSMGDFGALCPRNPRHIGHAIAGKPATQLGSIQPGNRDRVAWAEVAAHPDHPGRQETAALFAQGFGGAVVDENDALGLQSIGDPMFTVGEHRPSRKYEGSDVAARCDLEQNLRVPGVGDQDRDTAQAGPTCRFKLALHATQAESTRGVRAHQTAHVIDIMDGTDAIALGIEQAVHVGQQHEQIGPHQRGHHGRQLVIVTEADLFHCDRVVFVDNRHDAMGKQRVEGCPRVEVHVAVADAIVREEYLGNLHAVFAESLLVGVHQPRLACRCTGLKLSHLRGPARKPEARKAEGDGAGRHDHDLLPLCAQRMDLAGHLGEPAGVAGGDRLGSDLDDDAARLGQALSGLGLMHGVGFRGRGVARVLEPLRPNRRRRAGWFTSGRGEAYTRCVDDVPQLLTTDLPAWLLRITGFVFGCLWGSFFNVAIYRWPRGLSVVRPGSRCPGCGTSVRWYLNIPVLGFLMLRGRAACCGAKLSPRYVWVELLSGVLCLAVVEHWVLADEAPLLAALGEAGLYFTFVGGLLIATFVDLEWMEIPDEVSLPGAALGLATAGLRTAPGPLEAAVGAGVGFLVVQVAFVWVYELLTGRRGMGEGDAKLLMMVGAFLGWEAVVFCLVAGSVQGLLVAGVATLTGVPLVPDIRPESDANTTPAGDEAAHAGFHDAAAGPGPAMMVFGPMLALSSLEFLFFREHILQFLVDWTVG